MTLRYIKRNDAYKNDSLCHSHCSPRDKFGFCGLGFRKSALAVVFACFVLFVPAFVFVSCTDVVSPVVPVAPTPEKPIPGTSTTAVSVVEESKIVTICGRMTAANLDENGAVPSFFVGDARTANANRMALPTIDFETLQDDNDRYYDYYVKAKATKRYGTDLSEPVERELDSHYDSDNFTFGATPGTGSFSIALETGYNWTIELGMRWCDGYENEYSPKLIARKTFTALSESDANTPISLTLKPQMSRAGVDGAPADGYGRINLNIASSTLYNDYEIVLDGSNEDWTAANVTHSNGTITANSIKSGRYSVTLNFKKDGVIIYSSDQTINVYDNSTTNKWIGDGTSDSPITSEGVFEVTQTLINKFAGTNIYVASSGSATGNGSSQAPVSSFSSAFEIIKSRAAGVSTEDTETYTIRLLSDKTENVVIENGTFGVENASKIGKIIIKGYGEQKSITASNSGSPVISVDGTDPTEGAVPPVEFINLALTGGNRGLYARGEVNVTFTDCTISDNITASGNGAGVYADTNATVALSNCEITENTAAYGAGVYIGNNANVTLTGCTITENIASGNDGYGMAGAGAGIYVACGNDKTVTIQNCTISENTATNYNGGGIAAYNGNINLTDCTISGNSAKVGGGLYQYQYANAININSIEMTDNVAMDGKGGAMGADSALYCSVKLAGNVKIPKGSEAGENDICLKDKPLYLEDGLSLTDTVLITLDGYNTAEPMFTGSDSAYASNEGKFAFAISGSFESVFDYNVALSSSAIEVIPGSVIKVEAAVTKGGEEVTLAANDISWSFNLLCNGRPVPSVPASGLASSLTTGAGYATVRIPTTATVYSSMNYTLHVAATYKDITYDKDISLTYPWVLVAGATVTSAVGSGDSASSVFIAGRTVEIPDMYVCDHEVTQAEYQAVMGTNPSEFDGSSGKEAAAGETQANRPVERVSWYDALVYCNKKSIADGLTPCYTINGSKNPDDWGEVPTSSDNTWNAATCNFNANGYRLPTEAEWEYIARGGNGLAGTQTTYSGSGTVGDVAWYESNSGNKTHEVKKKTANSLGIYDMSGNVWELCWDWHGDIMSSTAASGVSSGSDRVRRGGSWRHDASICHVAYRINELTPGDKYDDLGFRIVRTEKSFVGTAYTALAAGTNGSAGPEGTYVLFGDWPQTIKAAGVTVDKNISKQVGAFTYYYGSDSAWYVKQQENAYTEGYTYSDGKAVAQGGTSTRYFKVEPIKWRVLTPSYNHDGDSETAVKKLLLAENVLINSAFYEDTDSRTVAGNTIYSNCYEFSRVRDYLNGLSYNKQGTTSDEFSGKGFLQTAFTGSLRNGIATTSVVNNAESTNPAESPTKWGSGANSYASNTSISDKIFLLSEKEATTTIYGFGSCDSYGDYNVRIRKPTDFAMSTGAYTYQFDHATYGGYWWLRSPDYQDGRSERTVCQDGMATSTDFVDRVYNGVVPALCLE